MQVLRPYTFISNLKVWDFYIEETLSEGPSYDWETRGRQERMAEETAEKPDTSGPKSQRKIVWPCYDSLSKVVPDAITKLLQDLQSLEAELGQTSEKWKDTWDKIKTTQRTETKLESKVRPGFDLTHGKHSSSRAAFRYSLFLQVPPVLCQHIVYLGC